MLLASNPTKVPKQLLLLVLSLSFPSSRAFLAALYSLPAVRATHRWRSSKSFDQFDYIQHWYPVIWACDLRPSQPTKVTLFDIDYVVAIDSDSQITTALRDRCPHKAAALSEGRITKSGLIQCAYHGWSFDGIAGDCRQIPQASDSTTFSKRTVS